MNLLYRSNAVGSSESAAHAEHAKENAGPRVALLLPAMNFVGRGQITLCGVSLLAAKAGGAARSSDAAAKSRDLRIERARRKPLCKCFKRMAQMAIWVSSE